MTTEVVAVQPWTPFREIVARLAEHRISAAPVLDAEGNLLHSQFTGDLEEGKSYNHDKMVEFLRQWAPKK
jgi:CBS-domain-containing membrane protein